MGSTLNPNIQYKCQGEFIRDSNDGVYSYKKNDFSLELSFSPKQAGIDVYFRDEEGQRGYFHEANPFQFVIITDQVLSAPSTTEGLRSHRFGKTHTAYFFGSNKEAAAFSKKVDKCASTEPEPEPMPDVVNRDEIDLTNSIRAIQSQLSENGQETINRLFKANFPLKSLLGLAKEMLAKETRQPATANQEDPVRQEIKEIRSQLSKNGQATIDKLLKANFPLKSLLGLAKEMLAKETSQPAPRPPATATPAPESRESLIENSALPPFLKKFLAQKSPMPIDELKAAISRFQKQYHVNPQSGPTEEVVATAPAAANEEAGEEAEPLTPPEEKVEEVTFESPPPPAESAASAAPATDPASAAAEPPASTPSETAEEKGVQQAATEETHEPAVATTATLPADSTQLKPAAMSHYEERINAISLLLDTLISSSNIIDWQRNSSLATEIPNLRRELKEVEGTKKLLSRLDELDMKRQRAFFAKIDEKYAPQIEAVNTQIQAVTKKGTTASEADFTPISLELARIERELTSIFGEEPKNWSSGLRDNMDIKKASLQKAGYPVTTANLPDTATPPEGLDIQKFDSAKQAFNEFLMAVDQKKLDILQDGKYVPGIIMQQAVALKDFQDKVRQLPDGTAVGMYTKNEIIQSLDGNPVEYAKITFRKAQQNLFEGLYFPAKKRVVDAILDMDREDRNEAADQSGGVLKPKPSYAEAKEVFLHIGKQLAEWLHAAVEASLLTEDNESLFSLSGVEADQKLLTQLHITPIHALPEGEVTVSPGLTKPMSEMIGHGIASLFATLNLGKSNTTQKKRVETLVESLEDLLNVWYQTNSGSNLTTIILPCAHPSQSNRLKYGIPTMKSKLAGILQINDIKEPADEAKFGEMPATAVAIEFVILYNKSGSISSELTLSVVGLYRKASEEVKKK